MKELKTTWFWKMPDYIWAPLWEGVLILIVGATAWASGHAWLFASLGPTAYEQVEKPDEPSSKLYNVVVGHFVGIGAGFFGLWAANAWSAPTVIAESFVTPVRLWAAVIAVSVTTLGNLLLRAGQPAALATTLLVALGAYQTAGGAAWIAAGVVILGVVGEPVRRFRVTGSKLHTMN